MRKALLLLSGILIQTLGSQAQAVNCGLAIAKSGTGNVKTYTLSVPATVPNYFFLVSPNNGVTINGTGLLRTVTYTYGGIYAAGLESPNYCTDSVGVLDTIVGPMDCSSVYGNLYASVNASTRMVNFTNVIYAQTPPGYTSSVVYSYGDGTSGTSSTHTYVNSVGGSITVTAVTTYTHPQYGSCTQTNTYSFYLPFPPCNATLVKSGTGMTRTYDVQSSTPNLQTQLVVERYSSPAQQSISQAITNTQTVPFTYTYAQPGYYRIQGSVNSANCQDTVGLYDTVVGPVNCAALVHSMTAYNYSGSAFQFIRNGTGDSSLPGYTPTVTYAYGDGTTGTSKYHTYTSSGNHLVTATTVLSHPTYGTCTYVDTVTVHPPANDITASVHWSNSINAAGASVKIWLINYDSNTQLLTAVDSALVTVSGVSYVSYNFMNKLAGDYRVKAHMINQPAAWATGFLPTYDSVAAYWNNARVVNHIGAANYSDIFLLQGTPITGPGFIGGSITQGANKGTAVGDPMGNITIFLRKAGNNNLVASTETDANGSFTFFNVPVGNYNLYPEELNYATVPSAAIQVTAANTTHTGKDFLREVVAKQIHPASLSVKDQTAGQITLSPNPAKERLTIEFATAPAKGTTIQLYNLSGQRVKSMEITNAQPTQHLELSGLAAGNYMLHFPTAKGSQVYQITVQP